MDSFTINRNQYLSINTHGYFHQFYRGYRKPENPDFLNKLKNQFNNEQSSVLESSRIEVENILKSDLPKIISENELSNCLVMCVPRSKCLNHYCSNQLMFKEAVSNAANNIVNAFDGTDLMYRVVDTLTTHLRHSENIVNDGEEPYPGITKDTCYISEDDIINSDIILIDDIYTRGVNIDEDCIQALLEKGANRVIFYAVGFTRRV